MEVVDTITAVMTVVVLKRKTMMQLWCSHAGGSEYGDGGMLVPMILSSSSIIPRVKEKVTMALWDMLC